MNKDLWRYKIDGLHPDTLNDINEGMKKGVFGGKTRFAGRELMTFGFDPEAPGCQLALKTLKHLHTPEGRPYAYALFKRKRMTVQGMGMYQLVVGTNLRVVRTLVKNRIAGSTIFKHIE